MTSAPPYLVLPVSECSAEDSRRPRFLVELFQSLGYSCCQGRGLGLGMKGLVHIPDGCCCCCYRITLTYRSFQSPRRRHSLCSLYAAVFIDYAVVDYISSDRPTDRHFAVRTVYQSLLLCRPGPYKANYLIHTNRRTECVSAQMYQRSCKV